jgi:hypothetical protein
MGRWNTRSLGCVLAVAALATAGCGSSGDGGGGGGSGGVGTGATPDNQGVLLTVLNYGRAARAAEICPLLSTAYAKKIGGGDAAKCGGKLGQAALCPCVSESLAARKLTITGDTADVETTRKSGQDLKISLVREGDTWKIDKLEPQHP